MLLYKPTVVGYVTGLLINVAYSKLPFESIIVGLLVKLYSAFLTLQKKYLDDIVSLAWILKFSPFLIKSNKILLL